MKLEELAKKTDCEIICGENNEEISGCYIGDLLSLAMSKIQKNNVWITIQTNINIAAVASLTEAGCIIICDGFLPDENTVQKAKSENIPILTSKISAYELAARLVRLEI